MTITAPRLPSAPPLPATWLSDRVRIGRPAPAAAAWLLGTVLALAVAMPIAYTGAADKLSNPAVVLAWLLVIYSAANVGRVLARGLPELMDATFWVFTYSFLALPALAQFASNLYPLPAIPFSQHTQVLAALVMWLGVAAYGAGRLLWHGRRSPTTPDESDSSVSDVGSGIAVTRVQVLGVLSLVIVGFAIHKYGIRPFFSSRDALSESVLGPAPTGVRFYEITNKANGTLIRLLMQVPILVAAYLMLYTRRVYGPRFTKYERSRLWPGWLLALLLIGNVIVNNPISNSRSWFGTVLLALFAAVVPLDRRALIRGLVVLLVVVSIFSMHSLAAFRRTGPPDFTNYSPSVALVSGPDYVSPQQIMNGIVYTRDNGDQFGRQLAGAVFVMVPRALWPSKPGDTGDLVAFGDQNNISASLWTEGQIDFGVFGVLAYLAMYGWVGRRLERRYLTRATRGSALAALLPVLAGYGLFLLRGSLQPAFGRLLPIVLLFLVVRGRAPQPASSDC
jgi:hypothetical protein